MNTSVPQSEEEKGRRGEGVGAKGRDCSEGGNAGNDVWQSRNLPLHWDMIGFSLVQEQQKKSKQMKFKMVL